MGLNPPSAAFLFTPTGSGNLWSKERTDMLLMDEGTGTGNGVATKPEGGQQPDKSNANGGGNGQAQMVQMSQADFDRIIGERVNRAKSTSNEELLKLLGVESPDQAKELIKTAQEAKEAQLTEVQKWQAKAEQAMKEADQARAAKEQAEGMNREANLRFAVMQEAAKATYNLNPQAVADVWTLIDKSEIKIDETGKVTGVDKALQALVTAKPYLVNANGAKSPGTPLRQRSQVAPTPTGQPVRTITKL